MLERVAAPREGIALGAVTTGIGEIRIACTAHAVVAIALPGEELPSVVSHRSDEGRLETMAPYKNQATAALIDQTSEELVAYVAGGLQRFTVPIAPAGSAFQQLVWGAVSEVPYGRTTTYGAVAAALGKPRAARAVGHANGANPLPIIVPCHRLVGHDGSLTGYGGGLTLKRWLLDHERQHLRPWTEHMFV